MLQLILKVVVTVSCLLSLLMYYLSCVIVNYYSAILCYDAFVALEFVQMLNCLNSILTVFLNLSSI